MKIYRGSLSFGFLLISCALINAQIEQEVQIDGQDVVDESITRSCQRPCKVVVCPRNCCPQPTAACGGIAQYAYIVNIDAGMAGQTVAQEANVFFNTNCLMTSGFTHNTGSNQDKIIILNPGTYRISWQLDQNSEGQWALFKTSIANPVGMLIPGSIFGAKGSDEISGHALFCLSAADIANGNNIIVLRNHTSFTPAIMLEARAGGSNATVNAAIYIEQLNCPGQSLC